MSLLAALSQLPVCLQLYTKSMLICLLLYTIVDEHRAERFYPVSAKKGDAPHLIGLTSSHKARNRAYGVIRWITSEWRDGIRI
jgi:hypothetical protein